MTPAAWRTFLRALQPAASWALKRAALPIIGLALCLGSLISPRPAGSLAEPWLDTGDRRVVEWAYAAEYADSAEPIAWTGDHDRCSPGSSADGLRQQTISRINFYRSMAGVEADVVLSHEQSMEAQHAALMMSAEGRLTHTPGEDFACFDETGQRAAANSNLYLGRTGPSAIDGYVEDPGDRNRDVGHRLTVLHPPTDTMGVGHVAGSNGHYPSNALWVFDEHVFDDTAPTREPSGFVAWPPRGFLPERLVYPRWSFALHEADMSDAEVTMMVNGVAIDLEVIERISKVGEVPSSVLVWEPRGLLAEIGAVTPSSGDPILTDDMHVTVVVYGVRPEVNQEAKTGASPILAFTDSEAQTFVYEVTIMAEDERSPVGSLFEASNRVAAATVRSVGSAVNMALG